MNNSRLDGLGTARQANRSLKCSEASHRGVSIDNDEVARRVARFTEQLEAGEHPDPNQLFAEFPEIESELRECLEALTFVVQATRSQAPSVAVDAVEIMETNEPRQLGDFRLLREIGSGGMGVVYEAEELSLGRRVALKVLPFAAMLDKRQLERFRNEARSAAMLQHSNIVRVFSVGLDRGVHFYTMELIDGQDLAQLIRALADKEQYDDSHKAASRDTTGTAAALSTYRSSNRRAYHDNVARIGIEAATALHYAHEMGVIHRDVKPANLLIDHKGSLRITDFGLATTQTDGSLTMSGDLLGTMRYMSPEQTAGANKIVDHRTDVYSLGLTLYELLALRPAFDGHDRRELLQQMEKAEPPRLRQFDKSIPRDLETIVDRAISRDRDARYSTAQEFSDDLQRFLENRPIVARRASRFESTRRWIARNRVVAALTAMVMMLLLTFAITSALTATRIAIEADAKEIRLYGQAMRLAYSAILRGDFVTPEEALIDWRPDPGKVDHRGWEWSYLWNASHDPAIERTFVYPFQVYDVEFVDDDKLAVSRLFGDLLTWNLQRKAKEEPLLRLEGDGCMELMRIAGSNRLIAGNSSGAICEWDMSQGERLYTASLDLPYSQSAIRSLSVDVGRSKVAVGLGTKGHGYVAVWDRIQRGWVFEADNFVHECHIAFGADGLLYVAERDSNKIAAIDIESRQTTEFEIGVSGICHLAATADQKQIVIIANPSRGKSVTANVLVWDLETRQVVEKRSLGSTPVSRVAVSRDGAMIAVGDDAGTVYLLDGKTLGSLQTKKTHSGRVNGVAFSSDGDRLATASNDGYARLWNVKRMVRGGVGNGRVILNKPLQYGFGAGFVDDATAVSLDRSGRVFFWDARSGEPTRMMQLPFSDTNIHQLAVSHDRRILAVTHGDLSKRIPSPAELHVIDTTTKSIIWSRHLESGLVYTVSSFSPDDRFLAVSAKDFVVVFDVASGEVVQRLDDGEEIDDGSYFKPATFSPDRRWLACGTNSGKVHMFSVPDYVRRRVITVNGVAEDVQFSPDSRFMAVVDFDNRITLFSPETGERIDRRFARSPAFLVFVRFSPDGRRLVTGGVDGMVRVWHAESGEELLSLDMAAGYFSTGNFSPDGNSIVVGNGPHAFVFAGSDAKNLPLLDKAELKELACETLSGHVRRRTDDSK